MHSPTTLAALALLASLALASGCDSGSGDDEHADHDEHAEGHATSESESGHAEESAGDTHGSATGETEGGDCAAETRDDAFAVGLSKSGSLVTATFVSSDPAPPIKGDNTWVLDFTDAQGMPLVDVEMVVIPMMPDHGHGTPINAVVTATETPGRYEVTPVNLFMAGYWEITFDLTVAGQADALMFGFCVE
jgi:hypothetical protein